MNQQEARRLFSEGAVFVLLDVPKGTEFGIDLKSWNVGEKFRGLKMIPQGIHYIYYSAADNYEQTSFRSGFFYNFHKGEFVVKKWDAKLEEISCEEVSENEIVQFKENIIALDEFLGPYPFEIFDKWKNNSCYLNAHLIEKLSPATGQINSAVQLEPCKKTDAISAPSTSKGITKLQKAEAQLSEMMKPKEGTTLRLTRFPAKNYPEGSSPREITRHCMDSSYVMETLISQHQREEDLLGEMQFCYILFLVGYSFDAFEHWKKLFTVLCSCVEAISKHSSFFEKFLSVLEMQILDISEDIFTDILIEDNFLYNKLRNFFNCIIISNSSTALTNKMTKLMKKLQAKFGWDFEDLSEDEGDDAPVVVDIT